MRSLGSLKPNAEFTGAADVQCNDQLGVMPEMSRRPLAGCRLDRTVGQRPGAKGKIVDFETLKNHVMDFFGDTSRSAGETKRDLLAIAEECQTLAESIDADDE
jgi:hypothetical protein